MKINKNINGFTLLELIVAISIVTTLLFGTANISFKYISDRQKLEIFTNKIISELERIRNNSLIGKGIGTNIIVPKQWKIDFNSGWNGTGTGNVITSYSDDGVVWIQENNLKNEKLIDIKNINCIDVSGTIIPLNTSETGSIIFEGGKYQLGGDCPNNYSNIEIKTYSKGFTGSINFDVVSGLIKK